MKKVVVACGSGVATSQTVASKLTRLLKERNLADIKVEVVDLKSLDAHIRDSKAYIAITKVDKEYPIPVVNGIAFLTGVGMEAELEKVIKACQ
ncbi:PTS sugar transporter subunit IIB [Klebsiella quasipneumoniae]|uniref:PTS sugar transporter subunit IIB n=1 Tax=Klebsiella quasipneumoniae TaxID=1463165 RepID=UPI000CEC93DE|nr:PTS sugar transporter subunit IIB [Klebsiella quasipneumoniae]ROC60476.1 PTS galactitol transporter subunit IIB [Klebsiella quasipneumoniae subsp. quasipneumoniae]